MISVAGFVSKLGLITESKGVCPIESCVKLFTNAVPAGPFLSPITRST